MKKLFPSGTTVLVLNFGGETVRGKYIKPHCIDKGKRFHLVDMGEKYRHDTGWESIDEPFYAIEESNIERISSIVSNNYEVIDVEE